MADELIPTPAQVKLGPGDHEFIDAILAAPIAAEVMAAGRLVYRNAPSQREYGVARAEGIGGPLGTFVAGMALNTPEAVGAPFRIVKRGIVVIGAAAAPVQAEGYFLAPYVAAEAGFMTDIDDVSFFAGQFRSFVGIGLTDGVSILLEPSSSQIQIL
jgi:hypothetical protein